MTLPYSFSAGQKAKAAEVNANFVYLKDTITQTASALQANVNSVQNSLDTVNSAAVKITGDQTVAGNKTFTGNNTHSGTNTFSGATTLSGAVTVSGSSFTFTRCTTAATTTSSASASKVAVIVQNYRNGKSWYRVWSDGWIEQGGNAKNGTTVSLIKNFATTDYNAQATKSVTSYDGNFELLSITSKAKGSFYLSQSGFTYAIYADWYACGY